MDKLDHLFENNRAWSERMLKGDPEFFTRLLKQQAPDYLWIGCADSRVPANEIVDLLPGELFVHRNVANVVVHTDLNCLSVLQFGVEVLGVRHVMVVGHYGCGGLRAALTRRKVGLSDNWLRHVQDVIKKHDPYLQTWSSLGERHDRLCELNVIEQVINVAETTIVQDAWERGQEITVHGWCYSLADGLVRDLGITAANNDALQEGYQRALAALPSSPEAREVHQLAGLNGHDVVLALRPGS
jgi:carbonic anhydrase